MMSVTDQEDEGNMTVTEEPTHQPCRMVVGHCPECGRVVAVFNNHETWPLMNCACGWRGTTTEIADRVRLEHNVNALWGAEEVPCLSPLDVA